MGSAVGSLTAATQNVPLQLANLGRSRTCRVSIIGTYTGLTGRVEASNDGITYVPLTGAREDTGGLVSGTFSVSASNISVVVATMGWSYFRFFCSAISTGTANVTVQDFTNVGVTDLLAVQPIVLTAVQTAITAATANALAVGPNGTTNPTLTVDTSAGSAATGWKLTGNAAASGVALSVVSSGTNENGTIDAKGSGTLSLQTVATGVVACGAATVVTSASATALTVGPAGATNPAFQVDGSTGSAATGLKVKSAAAAGGLALSVVSSGTNEPLFVDSKGSGIIKIGTTSTGLVSVGRGSLSVPVLSSTKVAIATQNGTPTAAQLLNGYLSHTSVTGAGTLTLDTAANIDAAVTGAATGDSFTCVYANIGTQTVTVTTAAGLSLKGTLAVPTLKTAILSFFKTGAGAWDVVCTLSA